MKLIFTQKNLVHHITICIVNKYKMQKLNLLYRKKNNPTNVLSFPLNYSFNQKVKFIGDIVLCEDIIYEESIKQKKLLIAHWAHIIIHGALHLKGYDHILKNQAKKMENLEIKFMNTLGYKNPYII